jgi:hypothetical protein
MAGEFASLVTEDQIPNVVAGIEKAVLKSFEEDRAPGRIILVTALPRITRDEVKRRSEICMKIFRELRGDLKWTVARIVDHLPKFLRMTLDGVSWEPEARRSSWAAGSK